MSEIDFLTDIQREILFGVLLRLPEKDLESTSDSPYFQFETYADELQTKYGKNVFDTALSELLKRHLLETRENMNGGKEYRLSKHYFRLITGIGCNKHRNFLSTVFCKSAICDETCRISVRTAWYFVLFCALFLLGYRSWDSLVEDTFMKWESLTQQVKHIEKQSELNERNRARILQLSEPEKQEELRFYKNMADEQFKNGKLSYSLDNYMEMLAIDPENTYARKHADQIRETSRRTKR